MLTQNETIKTREELKENYKRLNESEEIVLSDLQISREELHAVLDMNNPYPGHVWMVRDYLEDKLKEKGISMMPFSRLSDHSANRWYSYDTPWRNKKLKKFRFIPFSSCCLFLLLIISIIMTSCNQIKKYEIARVNTTASRTATKTEVKAPIGAVVKRFNTSRQFSCNVYVLKSDAGNILIDPGYYDNEMKEYIEEIGGLDAILLTHGHWDHINGLDALKADFPEVKVYIPEKDYEFLTNPVLNASSDNGFELIIKSEVQPIKEDKLNIANFEIDVISTPGHTIGSVMYYFKNENILFSGDTIMKDQTGPTFRPTGSDEDMKESIKKFRNLGYADETPVYSGHGDNTTYGYILHNNKDVKE